MQLFQVLFTLIWAATFGYASPTPASSSGGGASNQVEDNSYQAWKAHKSGMQAGKTYMFTALSPLTTAAKIAGDQDLQDARNGIGGDHVYLVAVKITSAESGPPKKRVTTLKAEAKYWDMYVKDKTTKVEMHEYNNWSTSIAEAKDIKYTYHHEHTSNQAVITKINNASKAYKAAHPNYDAKSNNCKTYADAVLAASK